LNGKSLIKDVFVDCFTFAPVHWLVERECTKVIQLNLCRTCQRLSSQHLQGLFSKNQFKKQYETTSIKKRCSRLKKQRDSRWLI